MGIDASSFLEGFRAALSGHGQGGLHLDAMRRDGNASGLVSGADTAMYSEGAWATAELIRKDTWLVTARAGPVAPRFDWLDDALAAGEQWAAYEYLATPHVHPGAVLQVGGRGTGLVRWMRATGRAGVLLSPFDSELDHCRALARAAGVVDSLTTVRAAAEAMPFQDGAIGTAFAPGVLHHTDVGATVGELARVVALDGRFATWDVWASPAYRAGIALLGKQEAIRCSPLNAERLGQIPVQVQVEVSWGGSFARYPVALLSRLGVHLRPEGTARLGLLDRALCRRVPLLRTVSASLVSLHGRGGRGGWGAPAAPGRAVLRRRSV